MRSLPAQVMQESEKLLVFDIKRFAVHDGDGIRTTVFLKGCGLRCEWCQNPEGLEKRRDVLYLSNTCIHCGLCMQKALDGQLTWDRDHPVVNHHYKGSQDNIVDACPSGALHYDSTWYTPEELMEEIHKDEAFFRHGGGVTFSGGEPLLAGDALITVLKQCQKEGIHTAVETALYVPAETVKKAAPYLNQMYCDMKIFDSAEHQKLTSQTNIQIKENLKWLLTSKHASKVIVRTPLIPGMTDSKENIQSITSWISSLYPDVKYELLNYNELASAKYPMTGRRYLPGSLKKLNEEQLNLLRNTAMKSGIRNLL